MLSLCPKSSIYHSHNVWKLLKRSHFPPIFVLLKVTFLVTLFDRKLEFSKIRQNWPLLAFLLTFVHSNVNVARFARMNATFSVIFKHRECGVTVCFYLVKRPYHKNMLSCWTRIFGQITFDSKPYLAVASKTITKSRIHSFQNNITDFEIFWFFAYKHSVSKSPKNVSFNFWN